MADTWLILTDGTVSEPLTQEQLTELISAGKVQKDTKICRTSDNCWKDAGSVPEICLMLEFAPSQQDGSSDYTIRDRIEGNDIHFSCPECDQHYKLAVFDFKAATFTCKTCKKTFRIEPALLVRS